MKKPTKKFLYKVLIGLGILILTGCTAEKSQNKTGENESYKEENFEKAELENKDADFLELGVVKEINNINKTLVVKSTTSETELELSYSVGTDIRDKYDKIISVTQVGIGEIVNVFYEKEKLIALKLSDEAWEYTKVANLKVNRSDKTMVIAEDKYKYNDNLLLISQGKFIDLLELNEKDVLTVRGYNRKICSITVEKGHGYVRLENDETFIGGWVEVGQEIASIITENMLILVPEGDYKLTAYKDGAGGTKSITVKRDEEITVNIGDLKAAPMKSGSIDFQISPEGATLYVDGTKTEYNELVVLEYGTHSLRVEADGHKIYTAKIVLNSSLATVEIDLGSTDTQEEDTDETEDTEDTKDVEDISSASGSIVEGYKIQVNLPAGSSVYFDGVYKGIAPVSFAKVTGNHTIILSKTGYETKSYTVYVSDEEEDAVFNFSDLGVNYIY